ncbi:phosphatase PAP2 family protein [Belnapia rosea]|uniref:Undecaprenyl-diphosphatase n=1 Tax=Belnapia rosea TaxID=938405 RepID=A0A1G6LXI0_9PROT|nr:phosphatase PAP2 family protein [Belnapia rosea]SDC47931.1 undecaprenyl-diphosphatase [Belnapia rosea]
MDQPGDPRPLSWLGRLAGQAAPLLALAICAGGLLGFLELMEVLEGEGRSYDEAVLRALRRPDDLADPIGPPWLELTMRDITALGGIPVLGLLSVLALGWLVLRRRWQSVVLLLISLPGGMLLNAMLKQGFDRPRPSLVAHLVEVETSSFPSGHAMLSAVGFLTLGALLAGAAKRRRERGYVLAVAVLLTLLIGGSRVYLGVHWPSDVLAGWCLGAAWAMGCWLLLRFGRRFMPLGRRG